MNRIDRDLQEAEAGTGDPARWLARGPAGGATRIPVKGRRQRSVIDVRHIEAAERVGRLAAFMAHEVRNPLAAMRQAIGLLGSNPALGEGDRVLVTLLLEELERVGRITSEFLAFSRPPAKRFASLPVRPLLEAAAKLLRSEPRLAEGVAVEISVARDTPQVHLDADLIRQVLWNLGLNAAEVAPRQGRIRFAARPMAYAGRPGVCIAVSDTGPGVPVAQRERVFEAFETTRAGGTGIGLALSRNAVLQHGGWIRVDEARGGGARFRIWLPLDGPDRSVPRAEEHAWRDS